MKTCDKCGTANLEWKRSRFGRFVLWTTTGTIEPHFLKCAEIQEQNKIAAEMDAYSERLLAKAADDLQAYREQIAQAEQQEADELDFSKEQIVGYWNGIPVIGIPEVSREEIVEFERTKAVALLNRSFYAPPAETKYEAPKTWNQQVYDAPKPASLPPVGSKEWVDLQYPKPFPKAKEKPATAANGLPRNIPCPKCSIPNRVTHADLIAGRACEHCNND